MPRWLSEGLVILVGLAAAAGLGRLTAPHPAPPSPVHQQQLVIRAAILDTVYRTDTVRVRVAVAHWDTLVQTVPPVTARETLYVATGQAAVTACREALTTCEARVAVRDSLLAVQDSTIRALAGRRGPWLRPYLDASLAPRGGTLRGEAGVSLGRGRWHPYGAVRAEDGRASGWVGLRFRP